MAFRVDPPKTNHTLDIQQAWYNLLYKLNTQLIDTGWQGILFVDGTDGNDATAKRGSISFKYATIQAALDAAQDGDVVWVGPGTYDEALTWPVDVNLLTLQGVGRGTVITTALGVPTLLIQPTSDDVRSLFIKDISIINTGGTLCVFVDGSAEPSFNLGLAGIVKIESVALASSGATSLATTTAGNIELTDVNSSNDGFAFSQTGRVLCNEILCADVAINNDPTGDVPATGFGAVVFNSAIADNVTVTNQGQFAASEPVQIQNLTATLIDTVEDYGTIIYSGRILGDIAVTFNFGTATDPMPLILDGAKISGTLTFGASVNGVGAACRALNATFYNGAADTITADSEATIDLRGAVFEQIALESADTLVTTPGTIDRTNWWQVVPAASLPDATITWANSGGDVPFTTAPDFVSVEIANVLDGPVAITAKTSLGCDVDSTAANADIVIKAFLSEI